MYNGVRPPSPRPTIPPLGSTVAISPFAFALPPPQWGRLVTRPRPVGAKESICVIFSNLCNLRY